MMKDKTEFSNSPSTQSPDNYLRVDEVPWGNPSAFLVLFILLVTVPWLIYKTNLQVSQFNMNKEMAWYNGVTIEEHEAILDAYIDLFQRTHPYPPQPEAFVLIGYLYIEKAKISGEEKWCIAAESAFLEAQAINPLDIYHADNLTRLKLIWSEHCYE